MIKLSDKRNYGIDLLRLVSMFMVVSLHVIDKGGFVPDDLNLPTINYWTMWPFEIMSYGAVDIFILISGYVGFRSSFKPSKILHLYLRTLFWQVVIMLSFMPMLRDFDKPLFIDSFTFISDGEWWFVTNYFALCLFMPILNHIINTLPKKTLLVSLISILALFSMYTPTMEQDSFHLLKGYSPLWMMIMYLVGGALAKYNVLAGKGKLFYFVGYLLMTAVTIGYKFIAEHAFRVDGIPINYDVLVSYISPTVVFASICMLGLFSRLSPPALMKKFIAMVTPCVLGVYIIHEHPYVRDLLIYDWPQRFDISMNDPFEYIPCTFCAITVIFTACLLLDLVREYLFRLVRIPKLLDWTDKKYHELMAKAKI